MPHQLQNTLILLCSLLLTGCSESPTEAMLENYNQRVANSLDMQTSLDLSQPLEIPAYPRRRDRILPVTDLRQGLIEVLNLRHCQILQLVAERNSSLGKVMPPSKQMVYEIELYIGLRDCLEQLTETDTDPELRTQVEAIFRIKDENFEAALWNGIFTSPAIERNFSLSEPALTLTAVEPFNISRQAMENLISIASINQGDRDWSRPAQLDQLEQHYQTLETQRFGSRWLRSLQLMTRTLSHTANLLEQRLQQSPFCYNKQATPKARILKNVFLKYYAGEVQPYLARIDQQGKLWLQLNQDLLQQFTATPPAMRQYASQVLSVDSPLWQTYLQSRDRHTRAWQSILGQCGLMPGTT